jgi:hypothetical protein
MLIPAIIVAVGVLLANVFSPTLSYPIASIVGFLLVIAASYFFAYLHVFKQTVWTIAYLELSDKKDVDIIVGE